VILKSFVFLGRYTISKIYLNTYLNIFLSPTKISQPNPQLIILIGISLTKCLPDKTDSHQKGSIGLGWTTFKALIKKNIKVKYYRFV